MSVTPQQGAVASTTNPFKEQGSGLAVIHEGKTIPSPIWPCIGDNSKNIHYGACVERNGEMKGKYRILMISSDACKLPIRFLSAFFLSFEIREH